MTLTKLLGSYARDRRGAAAIEFALLGPTLVLMLFGLIETGRLLWTQHTLDEVAYATVRCMTVSQNCIAEADQQAFAIARAASYGITLTAADVAMDANTSCKSFGGSNRVRLDADFNSVMRSLVPAFPRAIKAEACFPRMS